MKYIKCVSIEIPTRAEELKNLRAQIEVAKAQKQPIDPMLQQVADGRDEYTMIELFRSVWSNDQRFRSNLDGLRAAVRIEGALMKAYAKERTEGYAMIDDVDHNLWCDVVKKPLFPANPDGSEVLPYTSGNFYIKQANLEFANAVLRADDSIPVLEKSE